MSTVIVDVPRTLYDEAVRRGGLDIGELVVDALVKALNLDPEVAVRVRLELAVKYLNEGRELIDKDPVQASEKLHKAAEEVVKALAQHYDLKDVLGRVEGRGGRWTVTDLARAVAAIADRLGKWFEEAWDTANYLHVWGGFHEAKLDSELVRRRLPDIERMIQEAQKILGGEGKE
ncbi:PaREP1 family protein [Vulcanisaeta distributa]|uniref:PaREP1 family protein n=1 Tax=Vulcanisaeta distributa TaxID=164451 RepID=UPI000ABCAEF4|nr:PaREP1 family protein [Vulcanisaeta distributa]